MWPHPRPQKAVGMGASPKNESALPCRPLRGRFLLGVPTPRGSSYLTSWACLSWTPASSCRYSTIFHPIPPPTSFPGAPPVHAQSTPQAAASPLSPCSPPPRCPLTLSWQIYDTVNRYKLLYVFQHVLINVSTNFESPRMSSKNISRCTYISKPFTFFRKKTFQDMQSIECSISILGRSSCYKVSTLIVEFEKVRSANILLSTYIVRHQMYSLQMTLCVLNSFPYIQLYS
jgi:hypothetical protein